MNYYVRGFLIGKGRKSRAAQEDIWKDLREIAYAGLGDCERLLKRPQAAVAFYQRALHFDSKDPLVHFSLALAFTAIFDQSHKPETLPSARSHFQTMLALNADLEESQRARRYLATIDSVLESVEGKIHK